MKEKKLTHTDESGNPLMVDVSAKSATRRTARAQAVVRVGEAVLGEIRANELMTRKGPVFQTAVLAGISGAKKTSELIPLCHPIGLENCRIEISVVDGNIVINSVCTVSGKTGVEMEALTGVTVAALTIYDMCKALSHDIVIERIMLMEKTGGKNDFKRR